MKKNPGKYIVLLSMCAVLAGCATYPVSGKIERTGEKFVGTATSVAAGKSNLEITTDKGTSCSGEYIATVTMTLEQGASEKGTFKCDDGRSGTFAATGNSISGEGFGRMNNGDKLVIYYGQTNYVNAR